MPPFQCIFAICLLFFSFLWLKNDCVWKWQSLKGLQKWQEKSLYLWEYFDDFHRSCPNHQRSAGCERKPGRKNSLPCSVDLDAADFACPVLPKGAKRFGMDGHCPEGCRAMRHISMFHCFTASKAFHSGSFKWPGLRRPNSHLKDLVFSLLWRQSPIFLRPGGETRLFDPLVLGRPSTVACA